MPDRVSDRDPADEVIEPELMLAIRVIDTVDILLAAKLSGVGSVYLDLEHGLLSESAGNDLLSFAYLLDIRAYVRVGRLDQSVVSRLVEAGAQGVIVPGIGSVEEASKAAEVFQTTTRKVFHPAAPVCRASQLRMVSGREIKEAELILMIENEEGVAAVDGIVGVEGVGSILVGTTDLSHSLGIAGAFGDARLLGALRRVRSACRRSGRRFGVGGGAKDAAAARSVLAEIEPDFLTLGNDLMLLTMGLKRGIEASRERTSKGRRWETGLYRVVRVGCQFRFGLSARCLIPEFDGARGQNVRNSRAVKRSASGQ